MKDFEMNIDMDDAILINEYLTKHLRTKEVIVHFKIGLMNISSSTKKASDLIFRKGKGFGWLKEDVTLSIPFGKSPITFGIQEDELVFMESEYEGVSISIQYLGFDLLGFQDLMLEMYDLA